MLDVGNHAQLRNPMDYGLGILSVLSSWRSLGVGYTQNIASPLLVPRSSGEAVFGMHREEGGCHTV